MCVNADVCAVVGGGDSWNLNPAKPHGARLGLKMARE